MASSSRGPRWSWNGWSQPIIVLGGIWVPEAVFGWEVNAKATPVANNNKKFDVTLTGPTGLWQELKINRGAWPQGWYDLTCDYDNLKKVNG